MSEQPHDFISKRIEKTEKQILLHINKLNKKHSFDNLNKTEKLKEQLKMLELVFCYMHRKIKELNKELEGKK
jgi:GTPase Era involved in 16S rRNA processing